MSLFAELRRRNVFRIGVAYVIVAWILMQVAGLAAPALLLPDWVTTFVVFILLLGFPVALLLAWAYEVTPEGIKKTKDVPLGQSVGRLTGRKLDFAVIGLLAIAVLVLVVERNRTEPGQVTSDAGQNEKISIAVLPFDNMSDDSSQEHFADGLTEELLNSLAALDGLHVVSRTSSFTFKNPDQPIPEIAAILGVDHILEGSVRRAGDRIRVTAQLIDTRADSHLWSETFDRELSLSNILDIQEDVANLVADALHARIRPAERELLKSDGPKNIEALDRYHDGMYFLRQIQIGNVDFNSNSTFEASVAAFEASIAADPDWAPAHAALGRVHHFWRHIDEEEQFRRSRLHLMDALRLDNEHGPAYQSLGYINTMEGNFPAAFKAYDQAAKFGAEANWGRAILLLEVARYEEAIKFYRRAVTDDPLSQPVRSQLFAAYRCTGQFDEMVDVSERLIADNPNANYLKAAAAFALAKTGNQDEALKLAEEVALHDQTDAVIAPTLVLVGLKDRAEAAVLNEDPGRFWWQVSVAAVLLAKVDRALEILEQVEREAPERLSSMRCSQEIRNLAGNPRYDALLERLNLPE